MPLRLDPPSRAAARALAHGLVAVPLPAVLALAAVRPATYEGAASICGAVLAAAVFGYEWARSAVVRARGSTDRAEPGPERPVVEYDDGSRVYLAGWAGGAAPHGEWSTLTLRLVRPSGRQEHVRYARERDVLRAVRDARREAGGEAARG